MSNLTLTPTWGPVRRIKRTDRVDADDTTTNDGRGPSNWQAQDNGNRTEFLKRQVDLTGDAAISLVDGVNTIPPEQLDSYHLNLSPGGSFLDTRCRIALAAAEPGTHYVRLVSFPVTKGLSVTVGSRTLDVAAASGSPSDRCACLVVVGEDFVWASPASLGKF